MSVSAGADYKYANRLKYFCSSTVSQQQSHLLREYNIYIDIVDAANVHFCELLFKEQFLFCDNHFDLNTKTCSILVYLIEAVGLI